MGFSRQEYWSGLPFLSPCPSFFYWSNALSSLSSQSFLIEVLTRLGITTRTMIVILSVYHKNYLKIFRQSPSSKPLFSKMSTKVQRFRGLARSPRQVITKPVTEPTCRHTSYFGLLSMLAHKTYRSTLYKKRIETMEDRKE